MQNRSHQSVSDHQGGDLVSPNVSMTAFHQKEHRTALRQKFHAIIDTSQAKKRFSSDIYDRVSYYLKSWMRNSWSVRWKIVLLLVRGRVSSILDLENQVKVSAACSVKQRVVYMLNSICRGDTGILERAPIHDVSQFSHNDWVKIGDFLKLFLAPADNTGTDSEI